MIQVCDVGLKVQYKPACHALESQSERNIGLSIFPMQKGQPKE